MSPALDAWFVLWNLKWKSLEPEADTGLTAFVSYVVNKHISEEIRTNVIWCKDSDYSGDRENI